MEQEDERRRLAGAMRERRRELDVSQERAAIRCGLARSYYAEIERAKRNVSVSTLRKIAGGLELTAAELLERAGL